MRHVLASETIGGDATDPLKREGLRKWTRDRGEDRAAWLGGLLRVVGERLPPKLERLYAKQ